MVLAAAGVEHEELVSIAEPLLSDLPNVPRPDEPKSIYVGGDFRRHGESRVRTSIYTTLFTFSCIPFFSFVPFKHFYSPAKICFKGRVHTLLLLLKCLVDGIKRKML